MAITYFGSSSTPADNGNQAGATVAVTPPASMQVGDLAIIVAQYRGSVTLTMSETSGQSWTSETQISNTNVEGRIFWCRFNGTWGSAPSVTVTSGSLALSVVMHVFRPTNTGRLWEVDVAQVEADFTNASTNITITGITTVAPSTVTLATWMTPDDNTWGNQTGSGWVLTAAEQYRNTEGSDQSSTYAHYLQSSPGSTGNVKRQQLTLGADAGTSSIIAWKEFNRAGFVSPLVFLLGGNVAAPTTAALTPIPDTQVYNPRVHYQQRLTQAHIAATADATVAPVLPIPAPIPDVSQSMPMVRPVPIAKISIVEVPGYLVPPLLPLPPIPDSTLLNPFARGQAHREYLYAQSELSLTPSLPLPPIPDNTLTNPFSRGHPHWEYLYAQTVTDLTATLPLIPIPETSSHEPRRASGRGVLEQGVEPIFVETPLVLEPIPEVSQVQPLGPGRPIGGVSIAEPVLVPPPLEPIPEVSDVQPIRRVGTLCGEIVFEPPLFPTLPLPPIPDSALLNPFVRSNPHWGYLYVKSELELGPVLPLVPIPEAGLDNPLNRDKAHWEYLYAKSELESAAILPLVPIPEAPIGLPQRILRAVQSLEVAPVLVPPPPAPLDPLPEVSIWTPRIVTSKRHLVTPAAIDVFPYKSRLTYLNRLVYDEFENAWSADWSAHTTDANSGFSTDQAFSGDYSVKAYYDANEDQPVLLEKTSIRLTEFVGSWYEYFEPGFTWPTSSLKLFRAGRTISGDVLVFDVWAQFENTNLQITCYHQNGQGSNFSNSGFALPEGQWLRFDFYFRMNRPGMSDGIAQLWIDGVLKCEVTGLLRGNNSSMYVNYLWVGGNYSNLGGAPYDGGGPSLRYIDHVEWFGGNTVLDPTPDSDGATRVFVPRQLQLKKLSHLYVPASVVPLVDVAPPPPLDPMPEATPYQPDRTRKLPPALYAPSLAEVKPHATIRVNCGGPEYTDTLGRYWAADYGYSGGSTFSTVDAISGTVEDTLYQTERYDNTFTYDFTVPSGEYNVTIHLAEIFHTSSGQRVFSVAIEDVTVISEIDLYDTVGHDAAYQQTFRTTVTDGILTIYLFKLIDTAKISAIEIVPHVAEPIPDGTTLLNPIPRDRAHREYLYAESQLPIVLEVAELPVIPEVSNILPMRVPGRLPAVEGAEAPFVPAPELTPIPEVPSELPIRARVALPQGLSLTEPPAAPTLPLVPLPDSTLTNPFSRGKSNWSYLYAENELEFGPVLPLVPIPDNALLNPIPRDKPHREYLYAETTTDLTPTLPLVPLPETPLYQPSRVGPRTEAQSVEPILELFDPSRGALPVAPSYEPRGFARLVHGETVEPLLGIVEALTPIPETSNAGPLFQQSRHYLTTAGEGPLVDIVPPAALDPIPEVSEAPQQRVTWMPPAGPVEPLLELAPPALTPIPVGPESQPQGLWRALSYLYQASSEPPLLALAPPALDPLPEVSEAMPQRPARRIVTGETAYEFAPVLPLVPIPDAVAIPLLTLQRPLIVTLVEPLVVLLPEIPTVPDVDPRSLVQRRSAGLYLSSEPPLRELVESFYSALQAADINPRLWFSSREHLWAALQETPVTSLPVIIESVAHDPRLHPSQRAVFLDRLSADPVFVSISLISATAPIGGIINRTAGRPLEVQTRRRPWGSKTRNRPDLISGKKNSDE